MEANQVYTDRQMDQEDTTHTHTHTHTHVCACILVCMQMSNHYVVHQKLT